MLGSQLLAYMCLAGVCEPEALYFWVVYLPLISEGWNAFFPLDAPYCAAQKCKMRSLAGKKGSASGHALHEDLA